MVKALLEAYRARFSPKIDEGLLGDLQKLKLALSEPRLQLGSEALKLIESLIEKLEAPLRIGVLGQFSSGKSTLINSFLNGSYLPSALAPTSYVITSIKYSQKEALLLRQESGLSLLDVSAIKELGDQRKSELKAQEFLLFLPIEELKNIELIDSPGLNANEADEKSTTSLVNSLDCIIWLSLIDNAGRKSECDFLRSLNMPPQSICLISQSEKASKETKKIVLEHCLQAFSGIFSHVDFASAKALKAQLALLDKDKLKKARAKRVARDLQLFLSEECELLSSFYLELKKELEALDFEEGEDLLSEEILLMIKKSANNAASFFHAELESKSYSYFKPKAGFLHKGLYERYDYQAPFLACESIFSKLFYEQDGFSKELKSLSVHIKNAFLGLEDKENKPFIKLKHKLSLLSNKYSNIRPQSPLGSEFKYSKVSAFANSLEEFIYSFFKSNLQLFSLELSNFHEKLQLKTLSNFQHASKLSLLSNFERIELSRKFYEIDSKQFSIFSPSVGELLLSLLSNLNFYEFEELLQNKSFLKRLIKEQNKRQQEAKSQALALVNAKLKELFLHKNELDRAFAAFEQA